MQVSYAFQCSSMSQNLPKVLLPSTPPSTQYSTQYTVPCVQRRYTETASEFRHYCRADWCVTDAETSWRYVSNSCMLLCIHCGLIMFKKAWDCCYVLSLTFNGEWHQPGQCWGQICLGSSVLLPLDYLTVWLSDNSIALCKLFVRPISTKVSNNLCIYLVDV